MYKKINEKNIKEWWDSASEYYQKEISGDKMVDVNYGPFASSEKKLKLLGNINGKKILELGCGGGQASISLAKRGGLCTGIDISSNQIKAANKNAEKEKVNVNFLQIPFSTIHKLKPEKFDIVLSIMSLQYCINLKKLIKDVKDLMVDNGIFVFSIEHPFYLLIDPNDLKIKESYYNSGLVTKLEKWPDGSTHYFNYYNRKVSDIINLITNSGLKLEKIIEPLEKEDKIWGIGYRRALVNRIAPTIIFKYKK
jgi:2-polyprenyl-3-methyl-5-hydroxy-6-metoxy-1,4-benzoquinol methylase